MINTIFIMTGKVAEGTARPFPPQSQVLKPRPLADLSWGKNFQRFPSLVDCCCKNHSQNLLGHNETMNILLLSWFGIKKNFHCTSVIQINRFVPISDVVLQHRMSNYLGDFAPFVAFVPDRFGRFDGPPGEIPVNKETRNHFSLRLIT